MKIELFNKKSAYFDHHMLAASHLAPQNIVPGVRKTSD